MSRHAVFLIFVVGCGSSLPAPPVQSPPVATVVGSPTQAAATPKIKGITAADIAPSDKFRVIHQIQKSGGTDPENWTCTQDAHECDRSVFIAGDGPSSIRSIEARVMAKPGSSRSAPDLAADFFSQLVSLKYEGADPKAAEDWLIKVLGTEDSTEIGGVRFHTFANGRTCSLSMKAAN